MDISFGTHGFHFHADIYLNQTHFRRSLHHFNVFIKGKWLNVLISSKQHFSLTHHNSILFRLFSNLMTSSAATLKAPNPSRLEISLIQQAVNHSDRNRKIGGHLDHQEEAF